MAIIDVMYFSVFLNKDDDNGDDDHDHDGPRRRRRCCFSSLICSQGPRSLSLTASLSHPN